MKDLLKGPGLPQKGYSLIEVIIGLAIIVGLGLTSMRLAEYVQETKIRIAAKRELASLHRKARLLFENREACDASLSGHNFKGSSIPHRPSPKSNIALANTALHDHQTALPKNDGSKGDPIFSHDPNDKNSLGRPLNRFGPVEILATELIIPEHLSGTDSSRPAPPMRP